jgi:predicted DNA-binding protein (MmcQ/YjbR family)
MTADDFRRLALSLPEASESAHMKHPDFRVGGKIFATLGPDEAWGMVKLTPLQQGSFVRREPNTFQPIAGGWGRSGCTRVQLKAAEESSVLQALELAWRNALDGQAEARPRGKRVLKPRRGERGSSGK